MGSDARRIFLIGVLAVLSQELPGCAARPKSGDGSEPKVAHVSCFGYAKQGEFEYDARIVAALDFAPSSPDGLREFVIESAREQLKFASGNFKGPGQDPDVRHFSFTFEEPKIEILRLRRGSYGRTTAVDAVGDPSKLSPYAARAARRGEVLSDDPAVWADVRVRARAVACVQDAKARPSFELYLPTDPWLAYWLAPPSERRRLEWRQASAVANPCADDELSDLHEPGFYWYFWRPRMTLPSGAKCAKLLGDGLDLVAPRFAGDEAASVALAPERQPWPRTSALSVSLVFGWTETQSNSAQDLDDVERETRAALAGSSAPTFREGPRKFVEPTSSQFIDLARALRRDFAAEGFSVERTSSGLTVETVLRPPGSSRRIKLKAFWGPTDSLGPIRPAHWRFLREALERDDLVIYAGHSGLGSNMDLGSTVGLALTPKDRAQVVAILSCASVRYFSPSLFSAATKSPGRAYLFTGSDMSRFEVPIARLIRAVASDDRRSFDAAESLMSDQLYVLMTEGRGPSGEGFRHDDR